MNQAQAIAIPTVADYDAAFERERHNSFPEIDAFERRMGFALDCGKLDAAARVLACPVKRNAPCWQHGRVVYAATRYRLSRVAAQVRSSATLLDVGTAKGFSALCMLWAALDEADGERVPVIVSCDVIRPDARTIRNTVSEAIVGHPLTLAETLAPWPESGGIGFVCSTGEMYLKKSSLRFCVAFLDGKHRYDAVSVESRMLALRQVGGDVIIFDDMQIDGVARAVAELRGYDIETIRAKPERAYAVATKRPAF